MGIKAKRRTDGWRVKRKTLVKNAQFIGKGALVSMVAVVAIFVGCATTSLHGRADLLNFLADSRTTRQDVITTLGEPSARFEKDKVLTYRLGYESKNRGYYVVERELPTEAGWSTWSRATYSLVLVFDDDGVLCKHSLVEVN